MSEQSHAAYVDGEHDREWCEQEGESGDWKYGIVPLWGPGE